VKYQVLNSKNISYTRMYAKLFLIIFCIGLGCVVVLYANALSTNQFSNLNQNNGFIVKVRTNSSLVSGYDSHAQISCNKDEILTGGGYKSNFKEGLSVYQNGPSYDGKYWLVSARYTVGTFKGQAPPIEIYGMCMKFSS
jgi:hypothetical protein